MKDILKEVWIEKMSSELLTISKGVFTITDIINKYNDDPVVSKIAGKIDISEKDYIVDVIKNSFRFKGYHFNDKEEMVLISYDPFETIFETSGEIIVENDLRHYFKEELFDVNDTSGIIETMEHYAKQGMLHGFVGNSCPTLYLSEKNSEIMIGVDYDENTEEYILPDESYKELTSVCTDLWWYSIVDLEFFKKLHPSVDTSNFNIVKIPSGKWKLTHKYGISERGYHENLPYATLTKI